MRRRGWAALGAAVTGGAATCLLLTTGVVGTSLAALAPTLTPPAAAQELQYFDSCEQLRQWYVDAALPLVGPWGLAGPGYEPLNAVRATDVVPVAGVGSGDTGTNVQEAGVDEPDLAKTNGTLVVHLVGDRLVVTDVGGDKPRELSRTRLPHRMADPNLLLIGNRVLVIGDEQVPYYGGPALRDQPMRDDVMPSYGAGTTRVVGLDISDPGAPTIEQDDRIDGHLVSARAYDETVRVVLSTGAPALSFVSPTKGRSAPEARRENRQIVRDTTIDDWLPHLGTGALLDCGDVRHPEHRSGLGTISVLTFPADSPTERSATAVTAGGELVYSSTDRLYVATQRGGWFEPVPLSGRPLDRRPKSPSTEVHAFAIDGPTTQYVASGEVPGTVRDRWSFSEYDGHLRVATALGRHPWNPRENAVVVLDQHGDDLVETGRVAGLGPREQIQSVRWFGEIAILVTFRQMDPLYTVDLSDPRRPRVVGELKIPGFSSYLHPTGGGLLLGIGQDATREGRTTGAQAAVFDVSDPRSPRRLGSTGLGKHAQAVVAWESRAFTYLVGQRVALTPVQDTSNGTTRIAILRLHGDGTVTCTFTGRVAGWNAATVRTLPLGGDRVAVVAHGRVRLLRVG